MANELILVLDFGGQYCHLISRRVRDLGVYSEILPVNATVEKIQDLQPMGIILSGGPSSVYDEGAPKLPLDTFNFIIEKKIPLLGLCYGHHLIAQYIGGEVHPEKQKEYGKTACQIKIKESIFDGLNDTEIVWMSHGDQVKALPQGYKIFAITDTCPIAAYGNIEKKIYGLQFHPEVRHTQSGDKILNNFVYKVCGCSHTWKMDNWIPKTIEEIRTKVKDKGVVLGLSGGVDSSVTAILLQKAIDDKVHPIFVNNGLLRKGEVEEVVTLFRDTLKFKNFHYVDAEDFFLTKLKGVTDPEEKRKIIGHSFIEIFEKEAEKLKNEYTDIAFLGQGTIFPDRVETQATSNASAKIKSHHNVTLPEDMKLDLVEPLKDLYKDEVRKIGKKLGMPEDMINRHPFPGPGLAVRCLGELTKEKLDILRNADKIVVDEIKKAGKYLDLWQVFAVLIPVKSVGVMGDFRTYEYICAIRAVESSDAMTANFAKLDWDLLETISTKIINQVRGFNRVVYDISNKPPSTIEFE